MQPFSPPPPTQRDPNVNIKRVPSRESPESERRDFYVGLAVATGFVLCVTGVPVMAWRAIQSALAGGC